MIFWLVCGAVLAVGLFVAWAEEDPVPFFITAAVGLVLNLVIFGLFVPLIAEHATEQYQVVADNGSVKHIANVDDSVDTFTFTVKGKPTSLTVDKPNSDGYSLTTNVGTTNKTTVTQYCNKSSSFWAPWVITDSCWWVIDTPASN